MEQTRISTGLPGLDEAIDALRPGENVVWQIENLEQLSHWTTPSPLSLVSLVRVIYSVGSMKPLLSGNIRSRLRFLPERNLLSVRILALR